MSRMLCAPTQSCTPTPTKLESCLALMEEYWDWICVCTSKS